MKQEEVQFGGVYRLEINGELIGEFVPSNYWTKIYNDAQAHYGEENVKYSWVPFEKPAAAEPKTVTLYVHGTYGRGEYVESYADKFRDAGVPASVTDEEIGEACHDACYEVGLKAIFDSKTKEIKLVGIEGE